MREWSIRPRGLGGAPGYRAFLIVGLAGSLAAWIDGKLYIHYVGIRWRSSAEVKIKRFDIGVYVHQAKKDDTVWYDDVALSTGYIGPKTK